MNEMNLNAFNPSVAHSTKRTNVSIEATNKQIYSHREINGDVALAV